GAAALGHRPGRAGDDLFVPRPAVRPEILPRLVLGLLLPAGREPAAALLAHHLQPLQRHPFGPQGLPRLPAQRVLVASDSLETEDLPRLPRQPGLLLDLAEQVVAAPARADDH